MKLYDGMKLRLADGQVVMAILRSDTTTFDLRTHDFRIIDNVKVDEDVIGAQLLTDSEWEWARK